MKMDMTRKDCRKSAFTLIELLVVIGLMAMLATVSVAGYSAASRGMADRGAIQSTLSTLRVAQQTCLIDRVPTKVLFYNQLLSGSKNVGSAALYQGTAIAIKQAGRISVDPSGKGVGVLVDEFADWNLSYPTGGHGGQSGMRLFRMTAADKAKDIDGCSTIVNPYVSKVTLEDYMIQTGATNKKWCDEHASGNNVAWGFAATSGSVSDWHVGDPYGIEIARIDLPKGYIFGNSPPSGNRLTSASVAAVTFDPEESDPSMSASVPICLMRPAVGGSFAAKPVGTITANMLKDEFK